MKQTNRNGSYALNCIDLRISGSQSKEEGKYQDLIQLSTTPDPGYHMRKWQRHKKTSQTREPRHQAYPSR